jgi:hypothetical protein
MSQGQLHAPTTKHHLRRKVAFKNCFLPQAMQSTVQDHHRFYNTTILHSYAVRYKVSLINLLQASLTRNKTDRSWWDAYDLENMDSAGLVQWGRLKDADHTWIRLSFDFPFYGRVIRDLAISLKGFISTAARPPESNATALSTSEDYIAPLMANFALSAGNGSRVTYSEVRLSDGKRTELLVRWDKVGRLRSVEIIGQLLK